MPDLTSKCRSWREHLEVDEVFSSGVCAGRGQAAYSVVRRKFILTNNNVSIIKFRKIMMKTIIPSLLLICLMPFLTACQYFVSFQYHVISTNTSTIINIVENAAEKYDFRNDTKSSKIKNTIYLCASGYDDTNKHVGSFIVIRSYSNKTIIDGFCRQYGPNDTTKTFKKIKNELLVELKKSFPFDTYEMCGSNSKIDFEYKN